MTPDDRVNERVTFSPPETHPPCDQQCWTLVPAVGSQPAGWVKNGSVHEGCVWDGELKQWTRCQEATE